MYNKIIIAGNLSRDIEIRYTPGGSAIANTAIATTRKFKAADGTQKEEVLFIDVTFFGRTAEIANQYLRKGSKVLLDGRLKLEQWTAQDGSNRSKHSISVESLQMLDSKPTDGQSTAKHDNAHEASQRAATQPHQNETQYHDKLEQQLHHNPSFPDMEQDDEIPF